MRSHDRKVADADENATSKASDSGPPRTDPLTTPCEQKDYSPTLTNA
jgi:hypothetical protein